MAESSFNARAVSACDARGLMQITRRTWDWVCADLLGLTWDFDADAFDPRKNIIVGTCYLAWISDYLDRYEAKWNDSKDNLILACYNAGPGAVRKHCFSVPPFAETLNYVERINKMSNPPLM